MKVLIFVFYFILCICFYLFLPLLWVLSLRLTITQLEALQQRVSALEAEVKAKDADIAVLMESTKTIVQEKNVEIETVKKLLPVQPGVTEGDTR